MPFWKSDKPDRGTEIKKIAYDLGLSYRTKDDVGLLNLARDFKLFRIGTSKKITNIMWKDEPDMDPKVRLFDYRYTVSTGNSHQVFKQSVFFIQSKELGLPKFYMQPEHFFHKIGAWLGWDDIDFVSHQQFSDQYHLKGEHEDIIRDTFHPDALQYFTLEKGWHVEGLNYYLIIYRSKKLLKPEQLDIFYRKAMEIYDLLKQGGFSV